MKRCNRCYKLYDNNVFECPDCRCMLMPVPDFYKDIPPAPPTDKQMDFRIPETLKENINLQPDMQGIKNLRPENFGKTIIVPPPDDPEKPVPPEIFFDISAFTPYKIVSPEPAKKTSAVDYALIPSLTQHQLKPRKILDAPEFNQDAVKKCAFRPEQNGHAGYFPIFPGLLTVGAIVLIWLFWNLIQAVFPAIGICSLIVFLMLLLMTQRFLYTGRIFCASIIIGIALVICYQYTQLIAFDYLGTALSGGCLFLLYAGIHSGFHAVFGKNL